MEEQLGPNLVLFVDFIAALIGPNSRLWPGYFLFFILIAYAIYRYEGDRKFNFWKFLFPSEIYSHKSTRTDLKLLLTNSVLSSLGLLGALVSKTAITIWVVGKLGANTSEPASLHPILIAMILFVMSDFLTYWIHRIHHTAEPLWIFHAVHHSAEVLSPITVYRKHPLYNVFSKTIRTVVIGVLEGILLAYLVTSIDFTTLFGVNILIFIYSITGNNLRHSHIWLSYGPVISKILISPAMHQIHHSSDHKHFNKNFGGAFAIFDWMFGTLYIPVQKEELVFGLCDDQGRPIQPHKGLIGSFVVPFMHLGQWWVRRKAKSPNELPRAKTNL